MRALDKRILLSAGNDGEPLPSVRALAAHHGVCALTMHRSLVRLREAGQIHTFPRKGCYWGKAAPEPSAMPPSARVRIETVQARLLEDLRRGVFHPDKPLPDSRSLAEIYGVGARRLSELLSDLVERGWLSRRGRRTYPAPTTDAPPHATVLVVSRCDRDGMLVLDSERETDFLKSVRSECRELRVEPVFLGWSEDLGSGRFLDRDGQEWRPKRLRGVLLGAIVSTWLVHDPLSLLRRLQLMRCPVSVWWEHPAVEFPRSKTASLLGFNLSFGNSAGLVVGRHLRKLDLPAIAFVSPFHGSDWSRARLEGMRTALEGSGIEVVASTDATWESAWHCREACGGFAAGEEKIRRVLSDLLDRDGLDRYLAWVVVNDHAAELLIRLLRERGLPRPRIVSFDNTSASEAYQFDSFEFHTSGMVRQMLQHFLHPEAKLFRGGGLHEMVGRLVRRENDLPVRTGSRQPSE